MRLRDLIRIIRQRIDPIDLAAWLLLRVAEQRSNGHTPSPFKHKDVEQWLREHPDDVRNILTAVRDEMRARCKHGTLRNRIREVLGR